MQIRHIPTPFLKNTDRTPFHFEPQKQGVQVQFGAFPPTEKTAKKTVKRTLGAFLIALSTVFVIPPAINPVWTVPANCLAQAIVMPKERSPHNLECQILEKPVKKSVKKSELLNRYELPQEWLERKTLSESVEFTSPDGLQIKGLWLEAPSPSQKTMVLIHGIKMTLGMHSELAKEFTERGYNVLLFDLRAHGESEGQQVKLGLEEGRDIAAAVEFLVKNKSQQSQFIGLYGHSMGASSIMQAPIALEEYPEAMKTLIKHVDTIILDSPFASVSLTQVPVAHKLWGDYGKFLLGFLDKALEKVSQPYLGRSISQIDTVASFKNHPLAKKDILLIHGTEDQVTPINHGYYIYNQLKLNQSNVSKLIIEAGHLGDHYASPEVEIPFVTVVRDRENFKKVYEFLDKAVEKAELKDDFS